MPTTRPFSYSTVSDIYLIASAVGSLTSLQSADVAAYGGKAQELVNAKIVKQYSLPLTGIPAPLQTITEDLTCYYIFRSLYTAERFNDSPWPEKYREALTMLDQIATGDLALVSSGGSVVAGRTDVVEIWSNTKDYVPTFSELGPYDQVIDSDKLDDEADRRDLDGVADRVQ